MYMTFTETHRFWIRAATSGKTTFDDWTTAFQQIFEYSVKYKIHRIIVHYKFIAYLQNYKIDYTFYSEGDINFHIKKTCSGHGSHFKPKIHLDKFRGFGAKLFYRIFDFHTLPNEESKVLKFLLALFWIHLFNNINNDSMV